jgi:hypothetical protein
VEESGVGSAGSSENGRRVGAERKTRGGLEVDKRGLVCNFPEMQGLHCKAKTTFKP